MADAAAEGGRKRSFRKFSYRGVPLEQLLVVPDDQLRELVHARARRKMERGTRRKEIRLRNKLLAKKEIAVELNDGSKPELVKTHLRNMLITPAMISNVVGVYSGKDFTNVEIKPEMVGHYLGEFSITYHPVKHGRPGIGATHSSRFIPLK